MGRDLAERLQEDGEIRLNSPIELMRFTLVYDGSLPAQTAHDGRRADKHRIREAFHRQLAELWSERTPLRKSWDYYKRFGHEPLIEEVHPYLMNTVPSLPADVGFIHLDGAGEREGIAAHGRTPAMAHVPAGPVVAPGILTEDHATTGGPLDSPREAAVRRWRPALCGLLALSCLGVARPVWGATRLEAHREARRVLMNDGVADHRARARSVVDAFGDTAMAIREGRYCLEQRARGEVNFPVGRQHDGDSADHHERECQVFHEPQAGEVCDGLVNATRLVALGCAFIAAYFTACRDSVWLTRLFGGLFVGGWFGARLWWW